MRTSRRVALAALLCSIAPSVLTAQEESEDLARQLANPVAALISVPLQFNYDEGLGAEGEGEKFSLNLQPVVPFPINSKWMIVTRTIVPLISQSNVTGSGSDEIGVGDVVESVFFVPAKPSAGLIWGVGPVFLLPTGTDAAFSARKWGAGPTIVIAKQNGPVTVGALANHIISFAGDDDRRDVSSALLQPFLSRTAGAGWTFGLNSETTYDWEGEEWSLPVNATGSKVMKLGKQRAQVGGGLRYWVTSPDTVGPEGWGIRVNVTLLFPR